MEINSGIVFTKTEYVENSGQVKSNNFKVLPTKEWKPKSFVVGGNSGKVTLYKPLHGYIHGDSLKAILSQPIQSIELGGWGKDFRDRIFYTDGGTVIGQTKRNVVMFQKRCDFMNNLIRKIWIESHNVFLQTQNELSEVYSKSYGNNTERIGHYYHKEDGFLQDFVLLQQVQKEYHNVALTSDKQMKYIWRSECQGSQTTESQAVRNSILFRVPWVSKPNTYSDFQVAFQNGELTEYKIDSEKNFLKNWSLQSDKEVAITAYKLFDITQSGKMDIMVGLKGGNYEYYSQNLNGEYELLWGQNYGYTSQDIEGGEFNSLSYKEYLVSSDTGKIFGLGEKVKRQARANKINNETKKKKLIKKQKKEEEKKEQEVTKELSPRSKEEQLKKLNKEIEELKKNVDHLEVEKKKQDDLQKSQITEKQPEQVQKQQSLEQNFGEEIVLDEEKETQKPSDNLQSSKNELDDYVAPNTDVEGKKKRISRKNLEAWIINHDLSGNEEDGSLELMIVSEHPIYMISICSEMTDLEYQNPDENEAKISLNEDPINKYKNCVIHFLQEDIFEYNIKMFTREGVSGNFKIFVIGQNNQDFAQHIYLYLNPLFMHKLMDTVVSEEYLPNSISIQGDSLSSQDIYFWFNMFIPDFELNADDKFDNVCFENPFTQSYILIKHNENEGSIVIHSDSISTIYNLKKLIQDDTNMKGKMVDMRWDISPKSLKRNLKFLRNKLREHKRIQDQKLILDGLNDLNPKEGEEEFLSSEFKEIMSQKQEIEEQVKNLPQNQQYLKEMVINLYSDYSRLQGITEYEGKLDQLRQLLNKYKYKQVFELMNVKE